MHKYPRVRPLLPRTFESASMTPARISLSMWDAVRLLLTEMLG